MMTDHILLIILQGSYGIVRKATDANQGVFVSDTYTCPCIFKMILFLGYEDFEQEKASPKSRICRLASVDVAGSYHIISQEIS